MEKKRILNKGFFKRFIICLITYSLLMGGIVAALSDLLLSAHIAIKIIVGIVVVLLFVGLIIYIEISHRRKEK
ncbi:MAG: hypothetical protein J1F31_01665 [Erysipelotrichales bacterium]|nr:hypothetical protein [Erysipelotrichales bacterium]